VLRMILASCGQLRTTQIKTGSLCDTLPEFALVLFQPGARALRAGSAQLAALRPFPAGINIDALAGNMTFDVKDGGWFALPWKTTRHAVGDLVVTSKSAVQGATSSKQASCAYQLNPYRGISDHIALKVGVASTADVAQNPVNHFPNFSSPCLHTQLLRGVELTGEAVGAVTEDIVARAPRPVSRVDPGLFLTDSYGRKAVYFDSPDHNIHCGIFQAAVTSPPEMRFGCAIESYTYVEPPDVKKCGEYIHYGGGFTVDSTGPVQVLCRGGAMFDGEFKLVGILPYESSVTYEKVTCVSAHSAISCRDTTTGRGFAISDKSYSIY